MLKALIVGIFYLAIILTGYTVAYTMSKLGIFWLIVVGLVFSSIYWRK